MLPLPRPKSKRRLQEQVAPRIATTRAATMTHTDAETMTHNEAATGSEATVEDHRA